MCGKDGSIVFTSVRDGDIDLYRMDADGGNVRRLTHDVGYDGGAFFDADCTHIVWRASRPKPGPELDEYRTLLAQNLVRPTKLELYVANADGSDPMQVTYLDAASFGPAWLPARREPDGSTPAPLGEQRVIFASNYGDPRGREFDLWAIDVAGTRLERITAGARLRRVSAVLARRQAPGVRVEPRDAAGRARHQRFPGRLERRRRWNRWSSSAPIACSPTSAGWPIPRARAAASAPRASTPRARTSRSASARWAWRPRATPAVTASRSPCAPGSPSSRRPRCG